MSKNGIQTEELFIDIHKGHDNENPQKVNMFDLDVEIHEHEWFHNPFDEIDIL